MKTTATSSFRPFVPRHNGNRLVAHGTILCVSVLLIAAQGLTAEPPAAKRPRTWPQTYSVHRDEAAGILTLRTAYYTVEQDLKKGGAIARISLTHGKAANLLASPLATRVRDENGTVFTDLADSSPAVAHRREGLNEVVTVECSLKDLAGRASAIRAKTTFQYRWGYIKIHKELLAASGVSRPRGLPAVYRPCFEPLGVTVIGKGSRRRKRPRRFPLGATSGGSCVRAIRRTRPSAPATCRVL